MCAMVREKRRENVWGEKMGVIKRGRVLEKVISYLGKLHKKKTVRGHLGVGLNNHKM